MMKNEKEFFPEVPGRFLLMMERLKQGGAGREESREPWGFPGRCVRNRAFPTDELTYSPE